MKQEENGQDFRSTKTVNFSILRLGKERLHFNKRIEYSVKILRIESIENCVVVQHKTKIIFSIVF